MVREYKDSGIEWIGRIPKNWKVTEVKRIMRNKSVRNQPSAMVLSLYRDYGIVPKDSRDDNFNVTSEDTTNYKVVGVGDFVINKMKAWQGSMAVSEFDGIISPAYYVCSFTDNNICRKFIHYLLRNESYKPEYMRLSTGLRIGQWDLGIDDFMKIPIVLPPFEEQERIATFLDKKCAEIDSLVELQEQMIAQLTDYKQSVITEAVTKGLNPEAELVSSGIDWIGDVPKGWRVCKLKRFVSFQNGQDYKGIEVAEGFPVYGSGGIFAYASQYMYEGESILFGRKGTINKPLYINCKFWTVDTMYYTIPKKDVCAKFLYYAATTLPYDKYSTSTALPSMTQTILGNLNIAVPPISEQQAIASYLDAKCREIDSLIDLKRQKIEALKDYKKSIIFEAVTGKTDIINYP